MSDHSSDGPRRRLDPRHLDAYLHERLLDETYSGRTLARVLLRKLARRLGRRRPTIEPVAFYNALVVFDRPDLHGGGLSFGQDFGRILLELGLGRRSRLFEFCAGPGYIGYSLLAGGFCETLTLADINPLAVEAARHTARFNGIEHRVKIYESDGLSRIPPSETWDLVVGNPPHFLPRDSKENDIRAFDPGWEIHRAFYQSIRRFMAPGGQVVLMENAAGSSVDVFEPMIREGGGRVVSTRVGTDLRGQPDGLYYIVSEWSGHTQERTAAS